MKSIVLFVALIASTALVIPARADDIVIADFEAADYGKWEVTGEAFGPGPAKGTLPNQMHVSGYLGERLVNTFFNADKSTGTLTSPPFKIERRYVNFLIGGGHHAETCINLRVDGKAVRTASGSDNEGLMWWTWDVSEFVGREARIQIVDQHTGGWGHINIDHIVLSDESKVQQYANAPITRAMASVKAAEPRAAIDLMRPTFHVLSPAMWINDPNGPVHHNGFYHLFYQHNPYGDKWGHMHWGHVRSKDLVTWEHLPIALWPSLEKGEEHCFSGCAAVNGSGRVMLFYTSIARGGQRPAEQWAAIAEDKELVTWSKPTANPLVTTKPTDDIKFGDGMRDPFIFREGGRTFMIVGADLGEEAVIPIYEAADDTLLKWTYRGIMWRAPQSQVKFPECPNFFKLGDKWVLAISPYRRVEYFVGNLNLDTLKYETTGGPHLLDHGDSFYAPNGLIDDQQRLILFGWVRGFKEGRGWNGCMTLPRVMGLDEQGRVTQAPAPELTALRSEHRTRQPFTIDGGEMMPNDVKGDALEIEVEFEFSKATAAGVKLRRSADGARGHVVRYDGKQLHVAGQTAPLSMPADRRVKLRIYLDRSVLEVYADGGRVCVTRVVDGPIEDQGVSLFAEGGDVRVTRLDAWSMRSIWKAE